MVRLALAALTAMALSILPTPAHADDGDRFGPTPGDASYYFDAPGLVTLGAGAGYFTLALLGSPPAEPRFFNSEEGGAEYKGDTFPNWTLVLFASPTIATTLLVDTDTRWYHTKGALGALATTGLLTELSKILVGRHRPDYDPAHPEAGGEDGRKSFFSGHSSITLMSTTYLAWYLGKHVFPHHSDGLTWWQVGAYLGLAGVSVAVPLSRVIDNRHNPSDVLVGSLVGASVATGFFFWQDRRARRDRAAREASAPGAEHRPAGPNWMIAPSASPAGVSAFIRF